MAHTWMICIWGSLNATDVLRVHCKAFKYATMNAHHILGIPLIDQQSLSCFLNLKNIFIYLAHAFPCLDQF